MKIFANPDIDPDLVYEDICLDRGEIHGVAVSEPAYKEIP